MRAQPPLAPPPLQKLVAKATFPEAASAAQFGRYLYYRGRIYAVQVRSVLKGPPDTHSTT